MDGKDPKLLGPGEKEPQTAEPMGSSGWSVQVGQWYWIRSDDGTRWFGCVIHLGTNYAEVEGIRGGSTRIHFDEFCKDCEYVPDPDPIINGHIEHHRKNVSLLLNRVKEVTAALSIGTPTPLLSTTNETKALALRGSGQDMSEYNKALVKAKEETLPDLFKEIHNENEALAEWMSAKVIPLKAQAKGLTGLVEVINNRIFSVQLYAGLTEEIEQIRDGEPAALAAKLHLLQRRCYMDEECLARYTAGGMEFKDIHAFDEWLARPENADRLLPFPRCIVAFKVRRHTKHREMPDLRAFIRIMADEAADKATFLYIRNGERIYRMQTAIEFGSKLFPDVERSRLVGHKLWAKVWGSHRVEKLISDDEYQGMLEDLARQKREWKIRNATYKQALKTPEAKARAKAQGKNKPDAACVDVPWPGSEPYDHDLHDWVAYNPDTIYYDDITQKIQDDIQKHNRIALIIQGLLDRSPVLHPHPPWQIWTDEGFQAALELIYDKTRALVAGPQTNFEEYRSKLNASLQVGSITVGQEDAWERYEAKKEHKLRAHSRFDSGYRPTHVRPYGNPGPGRLARLVAFSRKTGKCLYAWNRKRLSSDHYGEDIRATFTCNMKKILNVDAYKPGDFHIFFDDPRTRADYLQWAPYLLEAEEYHAGNRKIEEPPPKQKLESSWEGQDRYRRLKRRRELLGKAARLTQQIKTQGGKVYEVDTLWRVGPGGPGTFSITGINEDGTDEINSKGCLVRYVRNVGPYDFRIDPSIPPNPTKPKAPKPKTKIDDDNDEDNESFDEDDEDDQE